MMDKTANDPSNVMTFGKLERPVAESKYIVRVKAKELNWRNFLYFSGMPILPAKILKTLTGDKYIKEWNYRVLPGTGPYTIREQDIVKGKSIAARRRTDYWAEKARANVGMYNFDEIRFVVVRDENLAFEMFKKGELDYYIVGRAKQWVEEGNTHFAQRRYNEALAAYKEAIKRDAKMVPARIGRGNALLELGYYQSALDAYERAIQLKPHLVEAYNDKATVLYEYQHYEDALAAYEQAIQLQPNNAVFYNCKSRTLKQLGRLKEAHQAYEKARRLGYTGRPTNGS